MTVCPSLAGAFRHVQRAYEANGGRGPLEIRVSRDLGERLLNEVRAHLVVKHDQPSFVQRGSEAFWWARIDNVDVTWAAKPVDIAPGKVGWL